MHNKEGAILKECWVPWSWGFALVLDEWTQRSCPGLVLRLRLLVKCSRIHLQWRRWFPAPVNAPLCVLTLASVHPSLGGSVHGGQSFTPCCWRSVQWAHSHLLPSSVSTENAYGFQLEKQAELMQRWWIEQLRVHVSSAKSLYGISHAGSTD